VRCGVQLPGLGAVARLAQHDGVAVDLADETGGELPGDVAVRAPLVHPPAVLEPFLSHGPLLPHCTVDRLSTAQGYRAPRGQGKGPGSCPYGIEPL
jgi:hypothetical protein